MLANQLRLYLVTDEHPDLVRRVELALQGGVTSVQFRRKQISDDQFLEEAKIIQTLCRRYEVPFMINDRLEIARKIGADGLHIGQEDEGISRARAIVGPNIKIGVSVHSVDEAKEAEQAGADYLGVGTLFPTLSKADTTPLSFETLLAIRKEVKIPMVCIGGITEDKIKLVPSMAVDGFAVISAILSNQDPKSATERLCKTIKSYVHGNEF